MKTYLVIILLVGVLFFGSSAEAGMNTVGNKNETLTPTSDSPLQDNSYDMVIITPESFSDALQLLVDHKNTHSINTIIKTVEDIYTQYQGRDKPEQIKYFIKDAIENWGIEYVLLVGGIDYIPIRNSAIHCSVYDFEYVPTDLYYADIYNENGSFCSWNTNQNELFGEFSWDWTNNNIEYIDDVNLYPDVGVGRLPCTSKKEVEVSVQKIIQYENTAYNQEWFHRLILMGGDTFPNVWKPEGEAVTEYVAEVMENYSFEPIKLWASLKTFRPLTINREISKGAGFVCFSGHGKEYEISTFIPGKNIRIHYFSPYLLALSNEYKLPIMFFDACKTAEFDFNIAGVKIPCFAWMAVKNPSGGAIAAIGSTRMAYGGYAENPLGGGSCRINANFFDAYKPGITVSQMFTKAQKAYLDDLWKDCLTIEEFNLIGDPSLKVGGYPS